MSKTNGFSRNADLYASSPAHSETGDLELALEVLGEPEGRTLLDVATGTGHTAFFFAEREAHVFAIDMDQQMLAVAQEEADRKSLSCRFLEGCADDLPFDDNSFDIVTSRLATHHFEAPGDFLAETRRVLRKGGQVLVIDNIVPENDPDGADWINDFERRRDPTHVACLTISDWRRLLSQNGFVDTAVQEYPKSLDYDSWMRRMSVTDPEADALWQTLLQAPDAVTRFLQPRVEKTRLLTLHRLVAVASRA